MAVPPSIQAHGPLRRPLSIASYSGIDTPEEETADSRQTGIALFIERKSHVYNEWPSVDLGAVVHGDETTAVAVDVIVKETGRFELDATPIT